MRIFTHDFAYVTTKYTTKKGKKLNKGDIVTVLTGITKKVNHVSIRTADNVAHKVPREDWDKCFTLRDIKHKENYIKRFEPAMKFYAACLVRGIETMHSQHFAHCDLKPSNFLINTENGYLQITDFGTIKKMENKLQVGGQVKLLMDHGELWEGATVTVTKIGKDTVDVKGRTGT